MSYSSPSRAVQRCQDTWAHPSSQELDVCCCQVLLERRKIEMSRHQMLRKKCHADELHQADTGGRIRCEDRCYIPGVLPPQLLGTAILSKHHSTPVNLALLKHNSFSSCLSKPRPVLWQLQGADPISPRAAWRSDAHIPLWGSNSSCLWWTRAALPLGENKLKLGAELMPDAWCPDVFSPSLSTLR